MQIVIVRGGSEERIELCADRRITFVRA